MIKFGLPYRYDLFDVEPFLLNGEISFFRLQHKQNSLTAPGQKARPCQKIQLLLPDFVMNCRTIEDIMIVK
jgi:hypothetical protein